MKKTLAVLTSGGDAPGMNACLRAIVRTATHVGWSVVGIKNGYRGLVEGRAIPMHLGSVGNIIQRGGTILGSSRCDEFKTAKGRAKAFEFLRSHRAEALVTLGGDGTFRGAEIFSKEFPIKVIGIPCTIDNDIWGCDASIGFDTAVNTAVSCIDKIRDTADSHGRVFVIEVMGRNTGHIALETALAVGAEFVIVPEKKVSIPQLMAKIQKGIDRGKTGSIVIVAEKDEPGRAFSISKALSKKISRDVRTAILGHLQRGGSPTCRDRNLASRMGSRAVELLVKGKSRMMVGVERDRLVVKPLGVTFGKRRSCDLKDFDLINVLSI